MVPARSNDRLVIAAVPQAFGRWVPSEEESDGVVRGVRIARVIVR